MALDALTHFLDQNQIRYVTLSFSRAYTAGEIAGSERIAGKELARTVPLKLGGELALAVLPEGADIDLDRLRAAFATEACRLGEDECRAQFKACECEALPPFGNLWNLKVVVDDLVAEDVEIAFKAGTHRDIIRMNYDDFERLVRPIPAAFAHRRCPGRKPASGPVVCGD